MNEQLKQRLTWGVFIAAVATGFILSGPWGALAAALVVHVAVSYEYFRLIRGLSVLQVVQCTLCSLLPTCGYLFFEYPGLFAGALLSVMVLSVLLLSWIEAAETAMEPRDIVAPALMGLVYPSLFAATLCICALEVPAVVLLWFIAVIVANDSTAYFVGKALGQRRIAERISPKKTFAGLLGGVAGGGLVSLLLGRALLIEQGAVTLLLYGGAISIFAVAGDLVESLVKRAFDVKDSGALIPGHGGVLDRVDALLFCAPLLFLLL